MKIILNGEPREIEPGTTLAALIAGLQTPPPYAAAVNRQFVPRSSHAEHRLRTGDQVEVIRPVTGG